jgi:2',3'-cyclic-nucleotide 2'-phosphodiesterase/3'-nucleotidase/5'-nucleotidase
MDLKGSELKAAFERSVGVYPLENGGFLHVSGFKVLFDSSKPAGERIVSLQYNNGTDFVDVEDATSYKVATNFFTAQGGDNYAEFKKAFDEGRVNDLGLIDWENFRDHLISLGEEVTPAVEGRIVDVNAAE